MNSAAESDRRVLVVDDNRAIHARTWFTDTLRRRAGAELRGMETA